MKNYFGFNLTGTKFLPVWLLFIVFFGVPYATALFMLRPTVPVSHPSVFVFPLLILSMIVGFIFSFYMNKLTIEGLVYKEKEVAFNGSIGKFIVIILLGSLLSILTLGIYLAWFIRDMQRFFINNSVFGSQNFDFRGKGGRLFLILTLTLVLPIIILTVIMTSYAIIHKGQSPLTGLIFPLVMVVMMIPYIYFANKWTVNINYKDYRITWETSFWNSIGKITIEIILSIITVGIYIPLAQVRLYKYFAERTVVGSNESTSRFGYDIDPLNDFLFIWGQTFLAIITLGIYYPWTFCKIRSRILSKTYLAKVL